MHALCTLLLTSVVTRFGDRQGLIVNLREKKTKVAIVVPMRDRAGHAQQFYAAMLEHEKKYPKTHFVFYFVEQTKLNKGRRFNRAMMFNFGLKEALKDDFDCIVIHDVDRLPVGDVAYEDCSRPTHLTTNFVPYGTFCGGVFSASPAHWKRINGMSNKFLGWGGEDDELFIRWRVAGLTPIHRPSLQRGSFNHLEDHDHTKRHRKHHGANLELLRLAEQQKTLAWTQNDGYRNLSEAMKALHVATIQSNPKQSKIPKLLHIVCIGEKHCESVQTIVRMWTALNPRWRLMTWNKNNSQKLANADKLKYKMSRAGAADILRMSAVYTYGGMYFDTDIVPFSPIHEWTDMKSDMLNVCNEEDNPQSSIMSIGWFAAPPKHPALKLAVDRIAHMTQSDFRKPPNEQTGPWFFRRVLQDSPVTYNQLSTVRIYSWPYGQPVPSKKRMRQLVQTKQVYGVHMWRHSWGPSPRNLIDTMYSLGIKVPALRADAKEAAAETLKPLAAPGKVSESFDLALKWCKTPALARALNFTTVSPPLHFMPHRPRTRFMRQAPVHMELRRGTCDLLLDAGCDRIEGGAIDSPDAWLLDVMEVILSDCNHSAVTCNTLDIGSNLGLVSLRMLQSGARLTAVEPQTDLCCASSASAQQNNFGQRSRFLCAGVGVSGSVSEGDVLSVSPNNYRYGLHAHAKGKISQMYTRLSLPRSVPLLKLSSIVGPRGTHYRFIKIDTDSVDCDLLRELLDRQRKGLLSFETVSLEVWTSAHCKGAKFARLLSDLQQDGYDLYRTPASTDNAPMTNTYEFQATRDNFPELTQNDVRLQTTSLLRFKKFTAAQWLAVPAAWTKQYQLLVSKAANLQQGKI